jgi:DNA-binding GntR family transcriptional regulator
MRLLQTQPSLAEQVHQAILSEVSSGAMPPGSRIIQEKIAQDLGVSRQPVQQALALLRKQGVLQDAPGRGLIVAPLDIDMVQQMYDVRSVLEALAFRKAAENNSLRAAKEGPALIKNGRSAMSKRSVKDMVSADIAFHSFIYELSGNTLIAPAMEAHWSNTQRVIGEVLMKVNRPEDVWTQHEELLQAVSKGNSKAAEELAREHIVETAQILIERLVEIRSKSLN